jgi:hypothetical protein
LDIRIPKNSWPELLDVGRKVLAWRFLFFNIMIYLQDHQETFFHSQCLLHF